MDTFILYQLAFIYIQTRIKNLIRSTVVLIMNMTKQLWLYFITVTRSVHSRKHVSYD